MGFFYYVKKLKNTSLKRVDESYDKKKIIIDQLITNLKNNIEIINNKSLETNENNSHSIAINMLAISTAIMTNIWKVWKILLKPK